MDKISYDFISVGFHEIGFSSFSIISVGFHEINFLPFEVESLLIKRRNLTLLFRPKRAHVRPRCRRISVVRSPVWFNRVVCRRGQRFGSRFQNLPGPPRLLPPCSRPLPPSFSSQAAEGDAAKKEEEMRQARRKAADQRRRRL